MNYPKGGKRRRPATVTCHSIICPLPYKRIYLFVTVGDLEEPCYCLQRTTSAVLISGMRFYPSRDFRIKTRMYAVGIGWQQVAGNVSSWLTLSRFKSYSQPLSWFACPPICLHLPTTLCLLVFALTSRLLSPIQNSQKRRPRLHLHPTCIVPVPRVCFL